MMKQHDMGPTPPNALAHETVDALRRALQRYIVHAPASEPAPDVRSGLHALRLAARSLRRSPGVALACILAGPSEALFLLGNDAFFTGQWEQLTEATEEGRAKQALRDKTLDGIDVAGHAGD